jgi:hypothetical protein
MAILRRGGNPSPPSVDPVAAPAGVEHYLPAGHPLFGRAKALSQNEYDARVVQTMAQVLADVPADTLHDPEAAHAYLGRHVLPAYLACRFAQHAKVTADREILPAAHTAVQDATTANDEARDHLRKRVELPDKRIPAGSGTVTVAHNRHRLAADTFLAESLRARGHADLLRPSHNRWAVPIALAMAALETTVSVRLFDLSLTSFDLWSFIGFVGFTLLEIIVTVVVPAVVVGPARRLLRERTAAAHRLNTGSAAAVSGRVGATN